MIFQRAPLRFLSLSALALACTFAGAGCRHRNPMPTPGEENTLPLPNTRPQPQPNQNTPTRQPKPGRADAIVDANLPVTLATGKAVYRRDEAISFTITLRNASAEPQKLSFSSGQSFDIMARRSDAEPDSAPVWRWGRGRIFTANITRITLRPGEERAFAASWDQSVDNGQVLPRGKYSIVAEIASKPRLASGANVIELAD